MTRWTASLMPCGPPVSSMSIATTDIACSACIAVKGLRWPRWGHRARCSYLQAANIPGLISGAAATIIYGVIDYTKEDFTQSVADETWSKRLRRMTSVLPFS